jgi:predicted nucleic acid-binding protein
LSGIYVDSSAALKRIFLEAGTDVVGRILADRVGSGEVVATSTLTWIEVTRAVLRSGVGDVDTRVESALSGIAGLPLGDAVLERARLIGPVELRSLAAIHLASAIALGATELLTFDLRLAAAAKSVGVRTIP